jgi:membrane dipeptidase
MHPGSGRVGLLKARIARLLTAASLNGTPMRAHTRHIRIALLLQIIALWARSAGSQAPDQIRDEAGLVHAAAIVIDTHADTTQRFLSPNGFDIGVRHSDGHVDVPRMRQGGLGGQFFSIWVPSDVTGPPAVEKSLRMIDAVREAVRTHPADLVLATTAAGIRQAHTDRKIAVLMGMEGGHMIDNDLGLLRMYAALGVRYLTLTHFKNNDWADSATDKPAHNGLTAFGRQVVGELNRLGMMVDVSHVSDKTFYDALEASRAPVIASHSSCRALSHHVRNMDDAMLRALAKNGGIVMTNYDVTYLSEELREAQDRQGRSVVSNRDEISTRCHGDEACATLETERETREAMINGTLPRVTWERIVDHIDHAVQVAGVDHVGLGSDFDGATMPFGMDDVSMLPKLTEALLRKGYSAADVTRILGGNLLRVMEQVERVAASR